MANNLVFKDSLPVAPLGIAALESCENLVTKVNDHIIQFRRSDIEELMRHKEDLCYHGYDVDSYLLHCSCLRFGAGEGKTVTNESVRDTDVFVMVDVINYSIPYTVNGYTNHMSPDDHFQDLKQIIGACPATAHEVNVVMPSLYESRQHERSKHESLDCAMTLEGLAALGVENVITFSAHDPRIQNAVPPIGFDNFVPAYQFVKALFSRDSNIRTDKERLVVTSPDEGAMNRIVYLASDPGVGMSMFYKCGDCSQIIGRHNPIVAHEFLGSSVEGKTILIIDDVISSGESMSDTRKGLREHKADKVIICYTFGLFTNDLERLGEYYHQGYLDYIVITNLNYRTRELIDRGWYLKADMSKYLAAAINSMNHDRSIGASLSPTEKIQKLVQKRQNGGYEYFQKLI